MIAPLTAYNLSLMKEKLSDIYNLKLLLPTDLKKPSFRQIDDVKIDFGTSDINKEIYSKCVANFNVNLPRIDEQFYALLFNFNSTKLNDLQAVFRFLTVLNYNNKLFDVNSTIILDVSYMIIFKFLKIYIEQNPNTNDFRDIEKEILRYLNYGEDLILWNDKIPYEITLLTIPNDELNFIQQIKSSSLLFKYFKFLLATIKIDNLFYFIFQYMKRNWQISKILDVIIYIKSSGDEDYRVGLFALFLIQWARHIYQPIDRKLKSLARDFWSEFLSKFSTPYNDPIIGIFIEMAKMWLSINMISNIIIIPDVTQPDSYPLLFDVLKTEWQQNIEIAWSNCESIMKTDRETKKIVEKYSNPTNSNYTNVDILTLHVLQEFLESLKTGVEPPMLSYILKAARNFAENPIETSKVEHTGIPFDIKRTVVMVNNFLYLWDGKTNQFAMDGMKEVLDVIFANGINK
jgi:hypothetical protein